MGLATPEVPLVQADEAHVPIHLRDSQNAQKRNHKISPDGNLKAAPNRPRAYLGKDFIAFSSWGKIAMCLKPFPMHTVVHIHITRCAQANNSV